MGAYLTTPEKVQSVYKGISELFDQACDDHDQNPSPQLENKIDIFKDAVEWFRNHYSDDLTSQIIEGNELQRLTEGFDRAAGRYRKTTSRRRRKLCVFMDDCGGFTKAVLNVPDSSD